MVSALEIEKPANLSWNAFINEEVARKRAAAATLDARLKPAPEGLHKTFFGQTRSGKTTLNRIELRMEKASLVIGTKPKRDVSLEKYVDEGYLRIDHWPPSSKELRERGRFEQVKLLLWPKIEKYGELKKHVPMYRRALEDTSTEGRWTLSIDEARWVCGNDGLGLGDIVSQIAFGGGSNGVSLHLVVQRPSGVPVLTYSSGHYYYVFKLGNTNDLRELASYTSQTPREFASAVRALNRGNPLKGHQFLFAPVVGGTPWATSEVPAEWA